ACGGGGGGGGGGAPVSTTPTTSSTFARTFVPDSLLIKTIDARAGASWTTERVFPAATFSSPVELKSARDGSNRIFVVEQAGRIIALAPVANPLTDDPARTTFLDIATRVRSGGEEGLLSVAFSPTFGADGRVFVSYSTGQSYTAGAPDQVRTRVSRFTRQAGNPNQLDGASEVVLLEVRKIFGNHNGGQLQFGPDGFLYASFGDGGGGGDPEKTGQDLSVLKGKILRIDPGTGSPYAVPADNPFVGTAGAAPETWAFGLRNPWRFSFDRATGDLWCADVGQGQWEEIDIIAKGGNYGWNAFEGAHPFSGGVTPLANPLAPLVEYSHGEGRSVTGGYVYRGSRLPALVGSYLYADFATGHIWAARRSGTTLASNTKLLNGTSLAVSSFGEDEAGEVYIVSYNGGIHRLAPTGGAASTFPQTLAATGLFSDLAAQKLRPEVIPYTVAEPLWSDGAAKSRGMLVPGLQKVTRTDRDAWTFPADSLLVKTFSLGARPIETRLLVQTSGQWYGYSYEWNDQGTDGALLPRAKQKTVNGQVWHYPGRGDCAQCHTSAAGFLLGVTSAQLNTDFDYRPLGGPLGNQLTVLDGVGIFTTPLGSLPAPRNGTLEQRARSYLDANCAMCHRPGGGTTTPLDLRYETPLGQTGMIGAPPQAGDLGVAGARIVANGDPARSVLHLRMTTLDTKTRMPPLASSVVDQAGAQLVSDWIRSIP
ncbi:MAG: PQQ-dependent sugar dehydrogenase, partial [Planctomycetota bacterium]